jgi:undecaprenyl pyrophosphate synthase
MQESHLRHLAVIAGGTLGSSGEAAVTVREACRLAATMAPEAFAAAPGLRAFSFLAPGIDRLLAEPASAASALRACAEAAPILQESAARCGATLRLCGRTGGLPEPLARHAGHPPTAGAGAGRTLLWFLRYGGRDEIARAAARFFGARPGATLADDDLDAWLDTSGVPDPDLIVLAGGALEAPDALVWQGSYAELWHSATDWAAFTAEELRRAVADFAARQRRFGG